MSYWHKNWQEKFPKQYREIDITYNNKTHRADVCINKYVIEFQHSHMTSIEFEERNRFYTAAGYKVIWIFDLSEQFYTGQISCNKITSIEKDSYKTLFNWNHRFRTFDNFYPHKNKNVIVFFQFSDDCCLTDEYDNELWMMNRVVWAIEDKEIGCSNFKRFYVRHDFSDFNKLSDNFDYTDSYKENTDKDNKDVSIEFGGTNGYICTDYEFVKAIINKDI